MTRELRFGAIALASAFLVSNALASPSPRVTPVGAQQAYNQALRRSTENLAAKTRWKPERLRGQGTAGHTPNGEKDVRAAALAGLDPGDGNAKDAVAFVQGVDAILAHNSERASRHERVMAPRTDVILEGNPGLDKSAIALGLARVLYAHGHGDGEGRVVDLTAKAESLTYGAEDERRKLLDTYAHQVVVVKRLDALHAGGSESYVATEWLADLAKRAHAGQLTLVIDAEPQDTSTVLGMSAVKKLAPKHVVYKDHSDEDLAYHLVREADELGYTIDSDLAGSVAASLGAKRGPGFRNELALKDALRDALTGLATRKEAAARAKQKIDGKHLVAADFGIHGGPSPRAVSARQELDKMVGLQSVKRTFDELDSLLAMNRADKAAGKKTTVPNLNALFTGNPGTGKTTAARLYGRYLSERGLLSDGGIVEVRAKDLVGSAIGETEKNIREAVAKARGKVLFIDEAYAFHDGARGSTANAFNKAALDTLVGLVSGEGNQDVAVVMAGYKPEMEEMIAKGNPGLARRFARTFHFDDYTLPELGRIFDKKLADGQLGVTPSGRKAALIELDKQRRGLRFGNGGAVETLVDNAMLKMSTRWKKAGGQGGRLELDAGDFATTRPTSAQAIHDLDALVGLGEVKKAFREFAALVTQNRERERAGLPSKIPNLNAVFYGNPGTGKTTVARLYGRFLREQGLLTDGEVVEVTPQDLLGQFQGHTGDNVKKLIERAQGKVLFIDEAYQLHGAANGTGSAQFSKEAVDALVAQIKAEGGQDIAIVMAGYKDEMETMFRDGNPGLSRRFARRFEFADYNADELRTILKKRVASEGFVMSPEAEAAAVDHLSRQSSMPRFGNAGAVDSLVQAAVLRQAGRVSQLARTSKQDFVRLEKADIANDPAQSDGKAADVFADLVGQDHIKTKFAEFEAMIADARHRGVDPRRYIKPYFLFTGRPGTGKTTVAQKMGSAFYKLGFLPSPDVVEVDAADLIASYEGQSANRTKDVFESALGKTLFIDEAYKLGDARSPYAKQSLERLLTLLEKYQGKLVVVLAGYDEHMAELMRVNPGLASRFKHLVRFPDTTPRAAYDKLVQLANEEHLALASDAAREMPQVVGELMKAPGWANFRDVGDLFDRALVKRAVRIYSSPNAEPKLSASDFRAAARELVEEKQAKAGLGASVQEPAGDFAIASASGASLPRASASSTSARRSVTRTRASAGAESDMRDPSEHEVDGASLIGKLYTAQEREALAAFQDAADQVKLVAADKAQMAAGEAPKAIVKALVAGRKITEAQATALAKTAVRALRKAEQKLAAMVRPAPKQAKLVVERVCVACGRPNHDFRPMEMTFAVYDTGERVLVGQKRLPGTGW